MESDFKANWKARLRNWRNRVRTLPRLLSRQQWLAVGGAVGAVLVAVVLTAVTVTPEQRSAALGEDLYAELMAEHPELREICRVERGAPGGAEANLLVLPEPVWERLQLEQRNSLGSWLNELGGDWSIRIGPQLADGKSVRADRTVITSREWNRQLK